MNGLEEISFFITDFFFYWNESSTFSFFFLKKDILLFDIYFLVSFFQYSSHFEVLFFLVLVRIS